MGHSPTSKTILHMSADNTVMTKGTDVDTGCCGATELMKRCKAHLPQAVEIKKQSEFLKAISDPARIKIIYALKEGELCVCELMEIMEMSQTVVSHHLKILKYAGITTDRRSGKWINYSLTDTRALTVLDELKSG